jgi:hypothetical protein
MLRAIPKSIFSWDFDVFEDERNVAFLDLAIIKESGQILVDDDEGKIYREGLVSGAYILEIDEGALAIAEKPSAMFRIFQIQSLDRHFTLKPAGLLSQNFILLEGEQRVGTIEKDSWFSRKCTVDVPDDLPLLVQVFFLYLVVLMWRRQSSSSG